jgi:hypothetical protein
MPGARKDVEHSFHVLQSHWGIVGIQAECIGSVDTMLVPVGVITACVIMHYMIVQHESDDLVYD